MTKILIFGIIWLEVIFISSIWRFLKRLILKLFRIIVFDFKKEFLEKEEKEKNEKQKRRL